VPALRNIAIIAHVDHGKTTLVDGMLRQSGTFGAHEKIAERVMDSMDLERERGITILSKNTAVQYGDYKINIVDTPGHADFGGEVERVLKMVDGALLLVDASEGPLPQTRFVLQKALAHGLELIVCVNKVDRPDARIDEVVNEIYDLFIDLDADENQIEFPILFACAKDGDCSLDPLVRGTDLTPLFDAIIESIPEPKGDPQAPLQVLVTSLDYDNYVGRLAIGRVMQGTLRRRAEVALCGVGSITNTKVNQLYTYDGLKRIEVDEVIAGDILAIAGIAALTIGDTIADRENPQALARVVVEEPTIGMTFTANNGPYSGLDGKFVTARQIRERLEKEMLHNVGLRMEDTESLERMRIYGRGELQLAILIEQMRREGFEMCVSKPEVKLKRDGETILEPWELATLDFPDSYMGVVTEKMSSRRGMMQTMRHMGSSRVRMEYLVPSRGLIGFRGEYLNDTRGLGILNTLFHGWDDWAGVIQYRATGGLIADRKGTTTTYALYKLQPRGRLFVGPGTKVYEGMIVGENARGNDMNVDPTKAKQLTNFRSSGADEKQILSPPVPMTLEWALDFIDEAELVEITPNFIRLRKKILPKNQRSVVRGRVAKTKAPA
jgi:GTP-binding protein